ncbi:hypothetical protein ACHAXN_005315 [Cyclotella atomus]
MMSSQSKAQDAAIIHTASHAIQAKLSTVQHGYYNDPFLRPMARGIADKSPRTLIQPIIRRGTHARVVAIDRSITSFLNMKLESKARQLVVLGSGRDTSYLRYRFGHFQTSSTADYDGEVRWYEVDHSSVITQKVFDWLPGCIPNGCELKRNAAVHHSDHYEATESYVLSIVCDKIHDNSKDNSSPIQQQSSYHLIGHDLRHPPSHLFHLLSHPQHGYNPSIPTLFIMECVFMYLPERSTRELLQYISHITVCSSSSSSSSGCNKEAFAAVVLYDPILNNDRFGNVMLYNLQKAGIILPKRQKENEDDDDEDGSRLSLEATATLSCQLSKFIECNYQKVVVSDMLSAYNNGVVQSQDVIKATQCEMLDELEEFELLMRHYCFCVAVAAIGDDSVGYGMVEVGADSVMGFQDGHCITNSG